MLEGVWEIIFTGYQGRIQDLRMRGGGGGGGVSVVHKSDTGGATNNYLWKHHQESTAES